MCNILRIRILVHFISPCLRWSQRLRRNEGCSLRSVNSSLWFQRPLNSVLTYCLCIQDTLKFLLILKMFKNIFISEVAAVGGLRCLQCFVISLVWILRGFYISKAERARREEQTKQLDYHILFTDSPCICHSLPPLPPSHPLGPATYHASLSLSEEKIKNNEKRQKQDKRGQISASPYEV